MMIQIIFKALVSVTMMRKMRKIEITFKALVTVMMMRKVQITCLSAGVSPWSPCRILICFTTVDFPLPPSSHFIKKFYIDQIFWNFTRLEGRLQAGLKSFCGVLRGLKVSQGDTSPSEVNIFRSPFMQAFQHVSIAINFNFVPRVESHIWRSLHRPMSPEFCQAEQILELVTEQTPS